MVTTKQLAKSLILTALGATPGIIWYFNAGTTQAIVITLLGSLVGFGLSLPGVSAARVAGGTAGMIVARNTHGELRDKVVRSVVGEVDSREDQDGTESN